MYSRYDFFEGTIPATYLPPERDEEKQTQITQITRISTDGDLAVSLNL